jgi:hypothetical protein
VVASEYWGSYVLYDALCLNRTDTATVHITARVRNGDGEGAARQQAIAFAKLAALDVEQVIPR